MNVWKRFVTAMNYCGVAQHRHNRPVHREQAIQPGGLSAHSDSLKSFGYVRHDCAGELINKMKRKEGGRADVTRTNTR